MNLVELRIYECSCPDWLEDRLETVYKKDARYSEKSKSLFALDLEAPKVGPRFSEIQYK